MAGRRSLTVSSAPGRRVGRTPAGSLQTPIPN